MCYDTALTKTKSQVQEYFHSEFSPDNPFVPYYHHSGFDHPNLQLIPLGQPHIILPARWGFIPTWGTGDIPAFEKRYNTLNLKSESVFEGVSKESIFDKRCLILADGFFEPQRKAGSSIPHLCYIPSRDFEDGRALFAFAGIYSELEKDASQLSCGILTMEANPFFAEIHNVKKRQPLVLDEGLYSHWLDADLSKTSILEIISQGFTSREFHAYPVSNDLYKRGSNSNTPEILREVQGPNLLF